MKSAQQLKRESVAKLLAWYVGHDEQSIREYVRGDRLNRSVISKELGFSRSSWGSNPRLKKALVGIERRLIEGGVLSAHESEKPIRDRSERKAMQNTQRLSSLEQQNASLQEENKRLKHKLKKLNLIDDFLEETGRLPR